MCLPEYVNILLSTYNGEKYVEELLDSLIQQDYPYIKILIRDDGSTDDTKKIIERYALRYKEKIRLLCDDKGNLGVTGSMFELLKESNAPYMIFCDQDDVWFKNKIRILVKAIKSKERLYKEIPLIIHCEAYTTDEHLKLVDNNPAHALQGYQIGRDKKQTSFANLLLCNAVQGASMLFNKSLKKELEIILDQKIRRHLIYDSIIASVCSIRGKIFFLNKPLMYYRQHSKNVVGARKTYLLKMNKYGKKDQDAVKSANFLVVNRAKCELIKRYYFKQLDQRKKMVLEHYMNTPNNWMEFIKLKLYKEFYLKQILIMMLYQIE